MASFFELILDTNSPKLEIIAPQYTSPDINTEIIIESSEPLLNYQDIYIIDNLGIRHDIILNFNVTELTGKVRLNDFPLGIATIYCRLKDEVGNLSELVSKTINITEGNVLKIYLEEQFNNIVLQENKCDLNITSQQNNFEITSVKQEIILTIFQRDIQIKI